MSWIMPRARHLFLFLLVLFTGPATAQFAVYTTYDDFVKETPKVHLRFKFHDQKGESDTRIILRDSVDRSKLEIECAGIWGFAYEGMLFRIIRKGAYFDGERENFPARLVHDEGLFYWANGYFLSATKYQQWGASLDDTYPGFVSATIDGDVVLAKGIYKVPASAETLAQRFFDDHPEFEWLEECVKVRVQVKEESGYPHKFVYHCITQHYRED